jgi:Semialdehyde dehydrogenase, NAD binding domain
VELFDVDRARECDVVFLAVSGDFSLEHAEAISEGVGGAVVIDNSVSADMIICLFIYSPCFVDVAAINSCCWFYCCCRCTVMLSSSRY